MAKFITLAGKKQTGKDTSASFISEILLEKGVQSTITHFADSLKQACHIIFGIPLEDMETEEGKKKLTEIVWPWRAEIPLSYKELGRKNPFAWKLLKYKEYPKLKKYMTVREVLQFVGTELFREQLDPDIWVKSVFRKQYLTPVVIVADARFPNEADFAKNHGVLINVKRPIIDSGDNHASETALNNYNKYDIIINNDGSLKDLKDKLKRYTDRYL